MLDVHARGIERRPAERAVEIAYSETFPPVTRGNRPPDAAALHDTRATTGASVTRFVERRPNFRAVASSRSSSASCSVASATSCTRSSSPQRLERRTRDLARPGALISDRTSISLRTAERRIAERVGRRGTTTTCC